MTSIERHEMRYQRRKHKRDLKKEALRAKTFDEVFSFENIYKAAKKNVVIILDGNLP